MKQVNNLLQVTVGLALLSVLGIGLVVVFNAMSRFGQSSAPAETSLGSPLPASPEATQTLLPYPYPYPPPFQTPHTPLPTSDLPFATMTADTATQLAAMTASAPAPITQSRVIYDPVNRFSLQLPTNWYVVTPDSNAIIGVTTITNYDISVVESQPPDGLSIQISIGDLNPDQSFEQWLSERRILETSPNYGASGVTLTEPQPYTLGDYEGITYSAYGPSGESTMVIYLLTDDQRIVGIGLGPTDSSVISEALLMLSTLNISLATP